MGTSSKSTLPIRFGRDGSPAIVAEIMRSKLGLDGAETDSGRGRRSRLLLMLLLLLVVLLAFLGLRKERPRDVRVDQLSDVFLV